MKDASFMEVADCPFPEQNGEITFSMGWKWAWATFTVHGGPFPNFEPGPNAFGVNLRAEQKHAGADAYLPIKDFSVPTQKPDEVAVTIEMAIKAAMLGKDVYMGCMGGWGRTGIALSLVAKTMGEKDPVAFVREHYSRRAVETSEQAAYVEKFDVTAIRSRLQKFAWRNKVRSILGLGG